MSTSQFLRRTEAPLAGTIVYLAGTAHIVVRTLVRLRRSAPRLIRCDVDEGIARVLFAAGDGRLHLLKSYAPDDAAFDELSALDRNKISANCLLGEQLASIGREGNHALDR